MQIFTFLLGVILFVAPFGCNGNGPVQWADEALSNPSEDYAETVTTTSGNQDQQRQGLDPDSDIEHETTVNYSGQTDDIHSTQQTIQHSQGQYNNVNLDNGNQETFSHSSFGTQQTYNQQQGPINHVEVNESEPSRNLPNPVESITIIVLGRSGSGVTSTIKELVGPLFPCKKPSGQETFKNFAEYTISNIPSIDGRDYRIKLLDVPGFIDGRTLEQDASILAGLKSYINENRNPTFYLALSRFDDNRIDGEHSLFVQFLKRIQLFQDLLPGANKDNTLFLLTRLMSETKATQRKPDSKINEFRRIIQEYTTFGSHSNAPVQVIVGENKAESEYGVRVENGYYRLPNKQHYPKNIWQAFFNMSSIWVEQTQQQSVVPSILTAVMNNREQAMKCDVHNVDNEWEFYDEDSEDYLYLIQRKNITTEATEVNQKIDEVYNTADEEMQFQGIVQKTSLLSQLQESNVTTNSSIPRNALEIAAFFQQTKISSGIAMFLLNQTFGLRMPEYIKSLFVGYGYDLLDDEVSPQTLFRTNTLVPNNVGYELPGYIKCRKFSKPENKYFLTYSQTYEEYFQERMNFFDFPGKANVSAASFKGKIKEGFNLKPEAGENIVTLSAVKEVRTVKCMLDRSHLKELFSAEFINALSSLTEFNPHDKDSENMWTNFFDRFGSHIITQAYGGGSIHGSLVGSNVKNVLSSPTTIDETLSAMIKFDKFPVPDLEPPTYRLYAGDRDPRTAKLYELDEVTRENLLKVWTQSLKADFDMFSNELDLEPISTIVSLHDPEVGTLVENALNLFLEGKLKYERKKKPSNPNKPKRNRTSTSQRPTRQPPTQTPPIYHLPTNTQIDPVPTSTSLGNTDRFDQNSLSQSSPGGDLTFLHTSYSNYYNRDSGSHQSIYPTPVPSRGTNRPSWNHQSNLPSSQDQTGGTYSSQSPIGNDQRLSSPYANTPYHPTASSQGSAVPSLSTDVGNEQLPPQVQSFIDQTSKSVDLLNARINQMRHQGDTRHQQQIRDLERERDEQMRRMEEKQAEYKRTFQLSEQTRERQFNSSLQTLEEQSRYHAQMTQNQMEEFRRREMEKDFQHKALMESIKRQREKEEAEERAKCSGWNKMKPWCW